MSTLSCFSCSKSFIYINDLISHIRSRHPKNSSLQCCFHNCNRSYSILLSYRKHLINHSKSFKTVNNIIPIIESNFNNNVNNISNFETNTNSNSELSFSNLRLDLIKQIVKAYCNETIPRKKTLEIVKSIVNCYRKQFIKKSKLQNCDVSADVLLFIEKLCDTDIIDSEYKFIKTLKNTNFFVEENFISLHNEFEELMISGGESILQNIENL